MSFTDTFTTNLKLEKPAVGASQDTWGDKSNTNWDTVDAQFAPTGTGTVVRKDANGNGLVSGLVVSAAAAMGRFIQFFTGTADLPAALRWQVGADGTAEGGSNAGSNYALTRYDDNGNFLGASLSFERKTGIATFEITPQVLTNLIYHTGNANILLEPVGTIKMYAGSNAADPPGGFFMLCDGRAISRTTYATLFALIGTTYGVGDGSTLFNIPNTAERVLVGQSAAQSLIPQFDARVLGNKFGEGQHLLSIAEMPAHTHPVSDPGHHHTVTAPAAQYQNQPGGGGVSSVSTGAGVSTSTSPTGITQADTNGGGGVHNNVQPALVINFIIRVQ
jgi:microcystin-dependent protein